jgi:CheY-like chemotaxis protein
VIDATAETQVGMPAVRDTIRSDPPDGCAETERVSIVDDHLGRPRTPDERAELDDRRWRILADQYSELVQSNAQLVRRATTRDRWEVAMGDALARINNALTLSLSSRAADRPEALSGQVVLVVEDDVHLLPAMRQILVNAGATVFYEKTALGARLRLERIGPDTLTCAVLDVRLQDCAGTGLAYDIRKRAPGCGVVLTSGHLLALEQLEGEADRHQFALLDKPFEPLALIDAVLAAIQLRNKDSRS